MVFLRFFEEVITDSCITLVHTLYQASAAVKDNQDLGVTKLTGVNVGLWVFIAYSLPALDVCSWCSYQRQ